MSCILRAEGTDFDVDAYIQDCPLDIVGIHRKGQPKSMQEPDELYSGSNLNINVSEADFDDFSGSIEDTIDFLREEFAEIARLRDYPGLDSIGIDFGIKQTAYVWSNRFPIELIRQCAELGLEIEISHYPVSNSEDEDSEEIEIDS